jgi:hypothetical protein
MAGDGGDLRRGASGFCEQGHGSAVQVVEVQVRNASVLRCGFPLCEAWARRFFDNWRASLKRQTLKHYEKFADMIDIQWDGIGLKILTCMRPML